MSCSEFREDLMEAARGAHCPAALAHARECGACLLLLRREQSLTAGLSALAASEVRGPSVALEFALVQRLKPKPRVAWQWATVAGFAAAAAVAAFFLVPRPTVKQVQAERHPLPVVDVPAPAVVPTLVAASRVKPRVRHVRNRPVPNDAPEEFIGIPYAAPLDPRERAELVRVNVPLTALTAWGMSIGGADPNLRVNADLVLGEDGLARAVRLVRK